MIRGTYLRDGEVTELYLGNGMTELIPAERYEPIHCFYWEKQKMEEKPKRDNRNWIWGTVIMATFLMGASLGAIAQKMSYCLPIFVGSLAWIGLVAWMNRR